jgi:hypothetical protein
MNEQIGLLRGSLLEAAASEFLLDLGSDAFIKEPVVVDSRISSRPCVWWRPVVGAVLPVISGPSP